MSVELYTLQALGFRYSFTASKAYTTFHVIRWWHFYRACKRLFAAFGLIASERDLYYADSLLQMK